MTCILVSVRGLFLSLLASSMLMTMKVITVSTIWKNLGNLGKDTLRILSLSWKIKEPSENFIGTRRMFVEVVSSKILFSAVLQVQSVIFLVPKCYINLILFKKISLQYWNIVIFFYGRFYFLLFLAEKIMQIMKILCNVKYVLILFHESLVYFKPASKDALILWLNSNETA